MKSARKRSVVIDGRRTSISLEDAFWTELNQIAHLQRVTLSELVARIGATRKQSNLSSAIRVFVLEHRQDESKQSGFAAHSRHGGRS